LDCAVEPGGLKTGLIPNLPDIRDSAKRKYGSFQVSGKISDTDVELVKKSNDSFGKV
jgi:hypothetical protein